jgi:hypothetical protein
MLRSKASNLGVATDVSCLTGGEGGGGGGGVTLWRGGGGEVAGKAVMRRAASPGIRGAGYGGSPLSQQVVC